MHIKLPCSSMLQSWSSAQLPWLSPCTARGRLTGLSDAPPCLVADGGPQQHEETHLCQWCRAQVHLLMLDPSKHEWCLTNMSYKLASHYPLLTTGAVLSWPWVTAARIADWLVTRAPRFDAPRPGATPAQEIVVPCLLGTGAPLHCAAAGALPPAAASWRTWRGRPGCPAGCARAPP